MLHVLTLTWNGLDKIKSLAANLLPNDNITWHIRDNGSKDGSKEFLIALSKQYSNIIPHFIANNLSTFAEGMNYLYKSLDNDQNDICLLNNDVIISSKALSGLQNKMNMAKADIAGMRLLYPNSNRIQHGGVIFSKKYNEMPFHYRVNEEDDVNSKKSRYFQAVTAAVMCIKSNAFSRVNGFDIGFRWAFDDVDLCLRIGQDGKIIYYGEDFAYHEESASLKKNPLNKLFLGNNFKYFRDKWAGKYDLDLEKYEADPNYNLIYE